MAEVVSQRIDSTTNKISGYACLKGEAFEVLVTQLVTLLGHGPTVDIDFGEADRSLSRQHARIEYNFAKLQFEITALSKNGIFLNSRRFLRNDGPQPLKHRDIIDLSLQIRFCFLLPAVAPSPSFAVPTESPFATPTPAPAPQLSPPPNGTAQSSTSVVAAGGTKIKISLAKRQPMDTSD